MRFTETSELHCGNCGKSVGIFIFKPDSPSYVAKQVLGTPMTEDRFLCNDCKLDEIILKESTSQKQENEM